MAHYKFDLVQETSTSTGTGALTLAGAVTRRRAFSAVLSNADTCYVLIESASAAEWEICLATYNSGGNTLSRGTVLSSSTGSAVSFSAGTKTISIVAPAAKSVVMDNNGDAAVTGTLTGTSTVFSGTVNGGYTGTAGYASLVSGGAGNNGYLGIYAPSLVRAGYVGFGAANEMRYTAEVAGGFHTWYSDGAERARLNSTGLGLGISPGFKLHVKNDSNTLMGLDRDNASNRKLAILLLQQGASRWEFGCDIGNANVQDFYIYDSVAANPRFIIDASGHLYPGYNDNSRNLGSASYRMAVIYAGTGAINTSGRAAKLSISEATVAEKRAAATIKAKPRRYKMADAVAEKGEARARWHFGYVAEDVRDALVAEKLDPWAYAFLCSDPLIKRETYFETATRAKMRKVTTTETAVEIIGGKPVMVAKQVERDEPVGVMVAVVDEAGQPVMQQMGADEETGEPILAPLMHLVPEMEEYEVEKTREVDTGEVRLGLRYSELEAFLRASD